MLRVWEVVFERFGFFNRSKADLLHGQKSSRGKEDDEKLNEEIDPPIFATKKSLADIAQKTHNAHTALLRILSDIQCTIAHNHPFFSCFLWLLWVKSERKKTASIAMCKRVCRYV